MPIETVQYLYIEAASRHGIYIKQKNLILRLLIRHHLLNSCSDHLFNIFIYTYIIYVFYFCLYALLYFKADVFPSVMFSQAKMF